MSRASLPRMSLPRPNLPRMSLRRQNLPRPSLRQRAGLLSVVAPIVLAACSLLPGASLSPHDQTLRDLAVHQAQWVAKGISDYRISIERSCFCPQAVYDITVVGGIVTKVTNDGAPVAPAEVQGIPKTVTELFALVAGLPPQAKVSVDYDADFGYPSRISVDPIAEAVDDEYTINVRSFTPAS
jgi:hypothetical protein